MADPEHRPPRGASAARKRSRIRSRGPYPDDPGADESANKIYMARRSRSTVALYGRGAARAASLGAVTRARSRNESAGDTSDAASDIGATPEATLQVSAPAGAKGAAIIKAATDGALKKAATDGAFKKATTSTVRLQNASAATADVALDKSVATATYLQDDSVEVTTAAEMDTDVPTPSFPLTGTRTEELLARADALRAEADRQYNARKKKDNAASEPMSTDLGDPRESDYAAACVGYYADLAAAAAATAAEAATAAAAAGGDAQSAARVSAWQQHVGSLTLYI
ncbi:hypothetical protein K1T71_002231 [Dendrolimus kikuchii]|uniref:Uncharacterized protein n=1 Tax=Dendrolimus kikuchii TaxID=765133 RepID=A0ACC1DGW4_9NEOP|nr:hypothetical protein K1T71_002231 [Dendrolimus kikuchii]